MNHVFLDQNNNFDVTLRCGDKVFYCHKFMLSARSPVFKAMFQSNMRENETNNVEIEDMQDDVMQELLEYIYTGYYGNFKRVAKGLLAAAEKYQVDHLEESSSNDVVL